VDWLSAHLKLSRREAIRVSQELIENDYLLSVGDDQLFRDGTFFYQFQDRAYGLVTTTLGRPRTDIHPRTSTSTGDGAIRPNRQHSMSPPRSPSIAAARNTTATDTEIPAEVLTPSHSNANTSTEDKQLADEDVDESLPVTQQLAARVARLQRMIAASGNTEAPSATSLVKPHMVDVATQKTITPPTPVPTPISAHHQQASTQPVASAVQSNPSTDVATPSATAYTSLPANAITTTSVEAPPSDPMQTSQPPQQPRVPHVPQGYLQPQSAQYYRALIPPPPAQVNLPPIEPLPTMSELQVH